MGPRGVKRFGVQGLRVSITGVFWGFGLGFTVKGKTTSSNKHCLPLLSPPEARALSCLQVTDDRTGKLIQLPHAVKEMRAGSPNIDCKCRSFCLQDPGSSQDSSKVHTLG